MLHIVTRSLLFVFAIPLFLLTSCGGGGSGSGSGNAEVVASTELNNQNQQAIDYVGQIESLMQSSQSTDERFDNVDPTKPLDILAILDDIDARSQLVDQIEAASNSLFSIEQTLAGTAVSGTQISNGSVSGQAVIPVILGVCALGLTATSWGVSTSENIKDTNRKKRQCNANYRDYLSRIPEGLNNAELDELYRLGHAALLACFEAAEGDFYWQYFQDTTLGFASVFGPGQINPGQGRILFQSASGALDVTTLYVIGTKDEGDNAQQGRFNQQNDTQNATPDSFIAVSEPNGSFIAPEGNWNIVAVTSDNVRFGTQPSQSIQVQTGQTTLADVETMPTSTSNVEDIRSCEPGGGVDNGSFNILGISNFDGETISSPSAEDIASASIQLSGDPERPTISWNFTDAASIIVTGSNLNTPLASEFLYGIAGVFIEEVPNTGIGFLEPFDSPLVYGDYTRPLTESLENFNIPSPDLSTGPANIYTIIISTESGQGASMSFQVIGN